MINGTKQRTEHERTILMGIKKHTKTDTKYYNTKVKNRSNTNNKRNKILMFAGSLKMESCTDGASSFSQE